MRVDGKQLTERGLHLYQDDIVVPDRIDGVVPPRILVANIGGENIDIPFRYRRTSIVYEKSSMT